MGNLNLDITENFVKLGYSKQMVNVYLLIYKNGSMSAKDIALKLGTSPNSLYRYLEKLSLDKLITTSSEWPKTYKAISPRFALDLLVKRKTLEIEECKERLITSLPTSNASDKSKIDIIGGAKELFNTYTEVSKNTKSEILIISIGEEVPEEVLLTNRDCLERGVKIYFIVHKYDHTNDSLLYRWKRMGIEVRHLPGAGFHLVIFDQSESLLSASNPNNTKERTTIHIKSQAISKALTQYFKSVWKDATPIV